MVDSDGGSELGGCEVLGCGASGDRRRELWVPSERDGRWPPSWAREWRSPRFYRPPLPYISHFGELPVPLGERFAAVDDLARARANRVVIC